MRHQGSYGGVSTSLNPLCTLNCVKKEPNMDDRPERKDTVKHTQEKSLVTLERFHSYDVKVWFMQKICALVQEVFTLLAKRMR